MNNQRWGKKKYSYPRAMNLESNRMQYQRLIWTDGRLELYSYKVKPLNELRITFFSRPVVFWRAGTALSEREKWKREAQNSPVQCSSILTRISLLSVEYQCLHICCIYITYKLLHSKYTRSSWPLDAWIYSEQLELQGVKFRVQVKHHSGPGLQSHCAYIFLAMSILYDKNCTHNTLYSIKLSIVQWLLRVSIMIPELEYHPTTGPSRRFWSSR